MSQSLLKLMCIESVMPSNYLTLGHPVLLLPSIFPSIRVFSSESSLRIRWPKYWRFSFSISPSNEYSGLISFRIYWFDLLLSKEIKPGGDTLCICTYFCFAIRLSDVLGTTQRTWFWASSGSWWWTGKSGVLQSMGSQRVGHDWVTELSTFYRLGTRYSNYPLLFVSTI